MGRDKKEITLLNLCDFTTAPTNCITQRCKLWEFVNNYFLGGKIVYRDSKNVKAHLFEQQKSNIIVVNVMPIK